MTGERSLASRVAFWSGHLVFAVLLLFAWKHAEARMINVDSAWQFFKWVNAPGLEVEAFRFSAIVPQLLVKCGVLAGASLSVLVKIASLSHVLVGVLVFMACTYLLDAPRSALACVLSAVLCTRLSFYTPVLEANYLLCYPFLLLGLLEGGHLEEARWTRKVAAFVALMIPLVVHPVGWVVMAVLLAYRYVAYIPGRRTVQWLFIVVIGWSLLGRAILPPSPYEKGLYTAILHGASDLSNIRQWASADYLVGHSWRDTAHLIPCWVLCAVFAITALVQRRGAVLVIVGLGWAGFIAINLLTYSSGESAAMMEKNFVPLAVLVAVPLVDLTAFRSGTWQLVFVTVLVAVLAVKLRYISFASRGAEARLEAVRTVSRSGVAAKRAMPHERLQHAGVDVHWALPIESLLVSSLSGPSGSVTVICSEECPGWELTTGLVLGAWGSDADTALLSGTYFTMHRGAYVSNLVP